MMNKIKSYVNSKISIVQKNIINKVLNVAESDLKKYFSLQNNLDIYFTTKKFNKNDYPIVATVHEYGVIIFELSDVKIDEKELLSTLFHELNHVKRNELFPTQNYHGLFNHAVMEGLAMAFEKQVSDDLGRDFFRPNSAKRSCGKPEIKSGLRKMLKITTEELSYNHYDWFYNLDQKSWQPTNFGYQIGEFIVEEFCKKHEISSSEALKIEWQEFFDFAKGLV